MSTLSTQYLGLPLRSPVVAASSPKTGSVDRLCALEAAGIGAVVLPSLFAEQLEFDDATELSELMELPAASESDLMVYNTGPESYLGLIREAKAALSVPVIASLNACTVGGWTHYSQLIQAAGADAIELNIYFLPTEPTVAGADIERRYCDIVRQVRCGVGIPMSVKVSPFFSSFPHMAAELYRAGAEGLVLFNRFLQPDIDLDHMAVRPRLWFSNSNEIRLALRWLAILRGRIPASFAATGGAHTADDCLKLLLAGADVVQIASVLFQRGIDHVATLNSEIEEWIEASPFDSVIDAVGRFSHSGFDDPEAIERAHYVKAISSVKNRQLH